MAWFDSYFRSMIGKILIGMIVISWFIGVHFALAFSVLKIKKHDEVIMRITQNIAGIAQAHNALDSQFQPVRTWFNDSKYSKK